jgi:hypothetical protein
MYWRPQYARQARIRAGKRPLCNRVALPSPLADFFYVPVFTSCLIYPVHGGSSNLRDWWYGPPHNRVMGSTNMLLEAHHWIRSHFPWWDRRGGRDHIWLVTHDEASCWVPAAIRPSIILSHWGRMGVNHTAQTAYWEDFYRQAAALRHEQAPQDWASLVAFLSAPALLPLTDALLPDPAARRWSTPSSTPRAFRASCAGTCMHATIPRRWGGTAAAAGPSPHAQPPAATPPKAPVVSHTPRWVV